MKTFSLASNAVLDLAGWLETAFHDPPTTVEVGTRLTSSGDIAGLGAIAALTGMLVLAVAIALVRLASRVRPHQLKPVQTTRCRATATTVFGIREEGANSDDDATRLDEGAVWIDDDAAPGDAASKSARPYGVRYTARPSHWLRPSSIPSRPLGLGPAEPLTGGRRIGGYELVECLGRGGMGEVWRARHRYLVRDAAIKVIRPDLLCAPGSGDVLLRRFEREVQVTATLTSPNTVRVFDFGVTSDGSFYYVMELLAGHALGSLVQSFGALSTGRACHILQQVCSSLAEAHSQGLVHGDVTPSNIHVCRQGLTYDFVKVLDFGLVSCVDRRLDVERWPDGLGTVTGTPGYMAPERILGRHAGPAADVYAVGCIAYYLLSATTVFGGSVEDVCASHVWATPHWPSQRGSAVTPLVEDLVMRCLRKNPNERPRDATALLALLDPCVDRWPWSPADAEAWWERHHPFATESDRLADMLVGAPAF